MPSAFPTQQANGIIDGTKGSLGFVDVDRLPEEGVKPFIIVFPITHIPGAVQQNFHFEEQPNITIRNIRGKEHLFTLDNCGFETKNWKFDKEWLTDEDTVQEKYLLAVEAFMKESLNCAKVVVFDWLVRKNTPLLEDRRFQKQLRPALNVHVDQTPGAAERRVRYHMGNKAEELLKHRYQIVNLWRPILEPVEDWLLIVCDYRIIRPEDAIYADTVGRGPYVGESVEEVWLLKQFDSYATTRPGKEAQIAPFSPYIAFDDPQAPKNARPRESIELRALVLYDEENERED